MALPKPQYLKHVLPCLQIWERDVNSLIETPTDGPYLIFLSLNPKAMKVIKLFLAMEYSWRQEPELSDHRCLHPEMC